MDVLKQLFAKHFHSQATQVLPLQGQLGGSGRSIIRLANKTNSAIGILYGVREENVAFLEFSRAFRRHGLPVPEIYADDLDHGAYLEEDLGDMTLYQFLSEHRKDDEISSEVIDAYRKVVAGPAAVSGRDARQDQLQSLLSARQLRSPVHHLGPELFQVLLSCAWLAFHSTSRRWKTTSRD